MPYADYFHGLRNANFGSRANNRVCGNQARTKTRKRPEHGKLNDIPRSLGILAGCPRCDGTLKTAPFPPSGIIPAEVQCHFVGAYAFTFPDAVCRHEQALVFFCASLERLQFVLRAPLQLGLDRSTRR